jgi:hypothetical protein
VAHSAACSVGIPCGLRYVNYFDFVTIPFLSLTAFVIITASLAIWKLGPQTADAAKVDHKGQR